MRIYVAGTFGDQKALRNEAHRLWDLGHEVTGSWLLEQARNPSMSSDEHKRKLAIKDVAEVTKADLIILDNRQSSGGKNCEWGMGIDQHQNKLLWLVGEPSNVFHYLADRRYKNWGQLIGDLVRMEED
jgi:hypothetical protein